jgi:hypothetical protein
VCVLMCVCVEARVWVCVRAQGKEVRCVYSQEVGLVRKV